MHSSFQGQVLKGIKCKTKTWKPAHKKGEIKLNAKILVQLTLTKKKKKILTSNIENNKQF